MLPTNKDREAKSNLINIKEVLVIFLNKELKEKKMRELL